MTPPSQPPENEPICVPEGQELRLYDPRRNPRDWIDLMGPTQCAVFLKDCRTSVSLNADGKPYPQANDTTCFVFHHLASARRFCEAKVQAFPHLRCEIFDSEGLARPPLLVVTHPDSAHGDDTSSLWSRRRKLIAVILFLMAPPLIWIDMRRANSLVLPTFLAFTCILTGLRFLYWDFGLKHRERERQKRLDAHEQREDAHR